MTSVRLSVILLTPPTVTTVVLLSINDAGTPKAVLNASAEMDIMKQTMGHAKVTKESIFFTSVSVF